ncbi:alkane oxidation protein activator PraA [Pseudomonas sessilinigenes]|uniref:Protein activator n=1 Tax=Pseudomonas sessilinigenes TaxID=658629 RepID=A0ABX8MYY5_9PSED|nr:alkane oxidation protein activator PraA [Pseudomonas sessilinigenes]AZC24675.1 protein activator [Pseudomonas sessilinigenes]QXH43599.1 protein activator [Pseudomonas sessilinigenes]
MNTIKTLFSVASCVICLGVTSMVSAATIEPKGASFTAPGTITVKSPASFNRAVKCNINFSGNVAADGSKATITGATVGGSNILCGVPVLQNLPWTLTATSTTSGTVSGVMFQVLSACSDTPATISGNWSNEQNKLWVSTPQQVGRCTITDLSVNPNPRFTVSD